MKKMKIGDIVCRKMSNGNTFHYGIVTGTSLDNSDFIQHVHANNRYSGKKDGLLFMRTDFRTFMDNGKCVEKEYWVAEYDDHYKFYTLPEIIDNCNKRLNEKVNYDIMENNCENYAISCKIKNYIRQGDQVHGIRATIGMGLILSTIGLVIIGCDLIMRAADAVFESEHGPTFLERMYDELRYDPLYTPVKSYKKFIDEH